MATINNQIASELLDEEEAARIASEEGLPVKTAELPPMSQEDQRRSNLEQSQPPTDIPPPTSRFPGPKPGSTSEVDLNIPENKAIYDQDYNEWWNMDPRDPQRDLLKNVFYQKYYGKTLDQIKEDNLKNGGFYPGANNLLNFQNTLQGLSVPGMAYADFFMDAVGMLPGAAALDNFWDRQTRLENPVHQNVRRVLSVVLPSIHSGRFTSTQLSKLPATMPRYHKIAATLGAWGIESSIIAGISDTSEDQNLAGVMAESFPGVFGEEGLAPFPDWYKTLDSDSPSVRKWKNMYENTIFSWMGLALGTFIQMKGAKKPMEWFEPKDELSKLYKRKEISKISDPDKLVEINELNDILNSKTLSREAEDQLINEIENLKAALGGVDNFEDALKQAEQSKTIDQDVAARRKIENGIKPDEFDPDVNPVLDTGTGTGPVAGSVARNMADTTAIKNGVSKGDPAPIMTESMRTKGLMSGDTTRGAVLGVAEQARDLGRFDALVDGFRFSTKQMNAAAWDIYTSIIAAENIDDVKALFYKDKDVANMLMGKFKVEYINEEQARAAAFAMRDLVDRYLGRNIAQTSARVMDTTGREISTIAESIQDLKPFVDDPRAMDLIIDKMQFLMDEYALNKYISGWRLRNKNWFDNAPPENIDKVIEDLTTEFRAAEESIHKKNLRFTAEIKRLTDENPLAVRPLVDAFELTNGDVDTLAKLYKYAADQVTPTGLLKSPNPKELNLFTRGVWGVIMNNVLSGLAALNAAKGTVGQITLKPINAILGHGIWGVAEDFEGLKRAFYYHGAVYETNRRALNQAYQMMKKAHKDPDLMIKAYRKDFTGGMMNDPKWELVEDMRPLWEAEGNYGRIIQLDMANTFRELALNPKLRVGMTAMVGPDVFAWTHLAHHISRARAYDDVFSEFGFADWTKIKIAERRHYQTMFDENGLIKDDVLRAMSGEVALNLDDGLASWINQATTAYPISKHMLMFPRTQGNWVKNALSWTPISLIPGINKYGKTIWAKTDDEIAAALAEHGIDFFTTPNARRLFEDLRAEYTGRIAFSSLLTKGLWDYAMGGNIRGNGHYNASRRAKERQLGYEPGTINLGGKWVNYEGIVGVEQILKLVGDLSYYAGDIDQPMMEDLHAKMMWTIAATFLNETPLQGIEPLVAAVNGDLTAWSRLVANSIRGYIPMSGAAGVLSNAITSTQKDIQGSVLEYLMNRTPILSSLLTDETDIWTGEAVNDIDNPWLKVLNAISPIKISGTREPWRVWLESTGWDGFSRLKRSANGSYEYTNKERQLIYKYIGEQQLYKELIKLMNNKELNAQLGQLRTHRATGDDLTNERIRLETQFLPVIQRIDRLVRNAQRIAEARLIQERPDIASAILKQQQANWQMKQGNVDAAREIQQKELETRQLLQMRK